MARLAAGAPLVPVVAASVGPEPRAAVPRWAHRSSPGPAAAGSGEGSSVGDIAAGGDTAVVGGTVPGEGIEVDIVLAGSLPVAAFADWGGRPRCFERRLLGEGWGRRLGRWWSCFAMRGGSGTSR